MRLLRAACALAALTCVAEPALADVGIQATRQRSWAVPLGFSPSSATLDSSPDGTISLAATFGVEQAATCVVVVATRDAARSVDLRPREMPSECVSVDVGPDGSVYARLRDPLALPEDVRAATVAVRPDSTYAWDVFDAALVRAEAVADGGTGAFQGLYSGAVAPAAYSPILGRYLAFTESSLEIGVTARPLTQAHVVDDARGALAVSGLGFGANGLGVVTLAAVRPDDGRFVLALEPEGAQETEYDFVLYDGRRDLERVVPLAPGAFRDRLPLALVPGRGERLHILWSESAEADASGGLTTVDWEGRGFLDVDLPSERLAGGEVLALGRPTGVLIDDERGLALVTHLVGNSPFVRVISLDEGLDWGVAPLGAATSELPLGLAYVDDGRVGLVTHDVTTGLISAWTLELEDLPDVPVEMEPEPDMGGFDPDGGIPPIDVPDAGEILCGCAQSEGEPPPAPLGVVLALLALAWRRRS